jgi:hypothetical protein
VQVNPPEYVTIPAKVIRHLQRQGCEVTYHFTLSDQLCSVKLGYDALQDLVADGGENPLIVIQTESLVNFGEMGCVWA